MPPQRERHGLPVFLVLFATAALFALAHARTGWAAPSQQGTVPPAQVPTATPSVGPVAITNTVTLPTVAAVTGTPGTTGTPTTLAPSTPTEHVTVTPGITSTLVAPVTSTPTATSAAGGPGVIISQFRTNGPRGPADEFIELVNTSQVNIDITNWRIEISDSRGITSTLLILAPGSAVQPGRHVLLASVGPSGPVTPTSLGYSGKVVPDQWYAGDVPDDGGIGLVLPNGRVVDQVGMSAAAAYRIPIPLAPLLGDTDQSYHRKPIDALGTCSYVPNNSLDFTQLAPSQPRNLSGPANYCAVLAAQAIAPGVLFGVLDNFRTTFFFNNIRGPRSWLDTTPATLVTNILLALLIALLFGFFGLLLYDTLESHEADLQRYLGGFNRVLRAGSNFQDRFALFLEHHRLSWLSDLFQIGIALLVFGLIYSLLDPDFSFDHPDVFVLILSVALSVGLVNLFDDIFKLIYVRRLGGRAAVRVHNGNFVIAAILVAISRVASLQPGLLTVGPGELEGEERGTPYALSVIGSLGYAVPAFLAFALLFFLPTPLPGTELWIATVLSLIFAIGLQTVFFEMIPIPGFYGREIFAKNRLLWFVFFAVFLFMFIQTQLNPKGEFLGAFNKPNMIGLLVFVLAFGVVTLAIYFYFLRIDRASAAAEGGEGKE